MNETADEFPPPRARRPALLVQLGIEDLEVKGSLFVPGWEPGVAYHAAWRWAKYNAKGRKFVTRKAEHEGQTGSRLWRLA